MKISKFACLIAVSLEPVVAQQTKDLPPSPLEAFAARSTAKVVLSKTIGRLEYRKSNATLSVLILEDPTSAPRSMRGVRIDLVHIDAYPHCDWRYAAWKIMCERANAAVYVEEARLVEVRDRLADGCAELRPGEFISEYGGTDGSGLIICGYEFPNGLPTELADLFTRAIAELGHASR
jgi:hypothetical protein